MMGRLIRRRPAYNAQIDALIAAGVPVGGCLNAAWATKVDKILTDRGIRLQHARDTFIRFALEGATVIGF
jgi:UDP-3-O-acyl-N-acetylglucosamine deacetylase